MNGVSRTRLIIAWVENLVVEGLRLGVKERTTKAFAIAHMVCDMELIWSGV